MSLRCRVSAGVYVIRGVKLLSGGEPGPQVNVLIAGDKISGLLPEGGAFPAGAEVIPGEGKWLLPGFIDLHVHGGGGGDFSSGDPEEIARILRTHLAGGTTAMLATILAADPGATGRALNAILAFQRQAGLGAAILGVHWEGPLLAPQAAGAQTPYPWTVPEIEGVITRYHPAIRLVTLAPEEPGSAELIPWLVSRNIIVSLGHTRATWDQARQAVDLGASRVTHLFNAMRSWHHREPGLAGEALLDDRVVAEVIADGIHLHPATLRLAYRLKGATGLNLVTDAMAACGMSDGTYTLGRNQVTVRDGQARTHGGYLAGSTLTMWRAVQNMRRLGQTPLEEAVAMATRIPARQLGLAGTKGEIAPGSDADLLMLNRQGAIELVFLQGRLVRLRGSSQGATQGSGDARPLV
ncbi:MAG: N-acetylglucosamine-6-phosphate deacetylase [Clostridia bacterium]|nr:MAG: N-acetylglucosamine-6-phosphate deacetylase [Clostridia bacterium]